MNEMHGLEALGILGVILGIFLVVLAVLWALLPFAVFGIKERLDRLSNQLNDITTQLERMTTQLGMMTTQLDKVAVLLDPDEEKASRHADYLLEKGAARRAEEERLKRERAMQEAEEQRRKEAEEQRRKAEEEREREVKKLEKLAKSEASLKCPYCNRAIRVKDLRPGMKHRCVFCNEVFQME